MSTKLLVHSVAAQAGSSSFPSIVTAWVAAAQRYVGRSAGAVAAMARSRNACISMTLSLPPARQQAAREPGTIRTKAHEHKPHRHRRVYRLHLPISAGGETGRR